MVKGTVVQCNELGYNDNSQTASSDCIKVKVNGTVVQCNELIYNDNSQTEFRLHKGNGKRDSCTVQ